MMRDLCSGLEMIAVTALLIVAGCSRDVRLAGKNVHNVTVHSVTYYGVVLDDQAAPEQVTYVLLRAIRDDFLAPTRQEREAALDKQFDVCAANVIKVRNRTSLSGDEFVYNVVYRWTPTVSHYLNNFETDWEKAKVRLVRSDVKRAAGAGSDVAECEVRMQLDDPSGDSNARVVMIVWLAKDGGFWRVLHLGFDPTTRSVGERERPASQVP